MGRLNGRFEVRIWDYGPPFDLIAELERIKLHPPKPGDEGGRGLLLMEVCATRLSYERTNDGRNCLTIIKELPIPERGRGLRLIELIATHFSYERTSDGRNCLTIIKELSIPERAAKG